MQLQTAPLTQWWENSIPVAKHPLQKEIFYDTTQNKVVVAGRRFGKTVLMIEECIKVARTVSHAICWIVEPTSSDAREIVWPNLLNRLKYLGVKFKANNTSCSVKLINKHGNTSRIYLKSAEDKNLRGRGLDFLGVDELEKVLDSKPNLWEQDLSPSLVDRKGRALLISSPKKRGQIKQFYNFGQAEHPDYDPNWKSWKYLTIENPFIDKAEIEKKRKTLSPSAFRQEYEASFEDDADQVYIEFDTNIHIKALELDYKLPLYLSFDFNVRNMTTSVCQIVNGKKEPYNNEFNMLIQEQEKVVNVIRSIHTDGGVISTQRQCDEVINYLQRINWKGDIYIFGDASGTQHETQSSEGNSDWEIIKNNFTEAYYSIPTTNPRVRNRINAVNMKLRNAANEIGLFINKTGCEPLIRDMEEVIFDKSGRIDKSLEYKGFVHNSDNVGYMITQEFPVKKDNDVLLGWIKL
jgi:hypothetical protein